MYDIKFNISNDMYHITGSETVIYTNAEDVELKEVKFRLFPNILGGDMHVDEVFVNDKVIIPNYTLNDSLLTVPLKIRGERWRGARGRCARTGTCISNDSRL